MSERNRIPSLPEIDSAQAQIIVGASGLALSAIASWSPEQTTEIIGKADFLVVNDTLLGAANVDIPPTTTFLVLAGGFGFLLANGLRKLFDD